MKKASSIVALAVLVCAVHAGVSRAASRETLTGGFIWNNDNLTGDLEAVFTPTGEGAWNVSFHFVWEDQPHVWSGTAEGSLTDGPLEGTVTTDGEQRATFVFSGSFEKGKFSGKHAQLRGDERRDTGTLTLVR